jgi:hypothetical protein
MAERKIVQIMPAPGWAAIFSDDEDELITPLVGWALVQDGDAAPAVVGLAAADKVELCEDHDNFLRYAFVSELIDEDDVFDFDDEDEDDLEEDDDDETYDPTSGLLN